MGENHLLQYVSIFFQIRNSFYNDFVLVQSFTSTQVATCWELQLSLFFQSFLEGSYNPLLLFIKHQMITKYISVTVHYGYQISNNKTNPEHLINREIQSTEHLNTETQLSLLWPAYRRSSPSAFLRPPAEILLLCCVPTHCSFNCSASCCFRDAPKDTIAPRLSLQRRTWKHYRAASFYFRDAPEPWSPCVPT